VHGCVDVEGVRRLEGVEVERCGDDQAHDPEHDPGPALVPAVDLRHLLVVPLLHGELERLDLASAAARNISSCLRTAICRGSCSTVFRIVSILSSTGGFPSASVGIRRSALFATPQLETMLSRRVSFRPSRGPDAQPAVPVRSRLRARSSSVRLCCLGSNVPSRTALTAATASQSCCRQAWKSCWSLCFLASEACSASFSSGPSSSVRIPVRRYLARIRNMLDIYGHAV
jgi:hypothetical protein